MIVFISNSGESFPIAYRIIQQGGRAVVYIHNSKYKSNYTGIVPRITASKLPGQIKQANAVVFDILRPNEKTDADKLLLKIFRCNRNVLEVFGAIADKISNKVLTIGASSETATWELDRAKGTKIAKQININVPETYHFNKLNQGAQFLKNKKDLWVFKPDNNQDLDLTYVEKYPGELKSKLEGEYRERLNNQFDFILQKKIEGQEISCEGWFNGKQFVHFNHTLENKKLMTGDLGPAIGSQSNTVWIKKNSEGLLIDKFKKLEPILRKTGYIGPIDFNLRISKKNHKSYFIEITARQGYDALYCLLTLIQDNIEDFYVNKFQTSRFANGFVSSQRITIPPFPYNESSLLKEYAEGVNIQTGLVPSFWWAEDVRIKDKKLICAGADGIVGVVTGYGRSIDQSIGNMYHNINKLKIASQMQYRTDAEKARIRLNILERWGNKID